MKKIFVLLFLFLFPIFSFASNFVGGEITFQCIGANAYQFNIACWTFGQVLPSDTVSIDFGDGGPLTNLSTPTSSNQINNSGYYNNVWNVIHTYAGPSGPTGYSIIVHFMNRIGGINNIPNSQNGQAVLSANVYVDPIIGNNSSPYMTDLNFIDAISSNQNFSNNPGPLDVDGDSLSFYFIPCADTSGVVAGYTFPNVLGGGILNIDSVTGNYLWNSPQNSGAYNVVIETKEWKHFTNGNLLIGYVTREIQFNSQQVIGINEIALSNFFLYPNPAKSGQKITIQSTSLLEKYHARIYNSFGQIVWEKWDQSNNTLELPDLSNGIYFMEIDNESKTISSSKLMIENN